MTLESINPSLPRPAHIERPSSRPVTVPVTMRKAFVREYEGVVVIISREAMQIKELP